MTTLEEVFIAANNEAEPQDNTTNPTSNTNANSVTTGDTLIG